MTELPRGRPARLDSLWEDCAQNHKQLSKPRDARWVINPTLLHGGGAAGRGEEGDGGRVGVDPDLDALHNVLLRLVILAFK
jgi:hypothetical protein